MNLAINEGLDEVFPGIFVGDVFAGADAAALKKRSITRILDVSDLEEPRQMPAGVKRVQIVLVDEAGNKASSYVEAIEYLTRARYDDTKILVHCMAGVSRSPSVVLGYVIRNERRLIEHISPEKHGKSYLPSSMPESIAWHPLYDTLKQGFAAMYVRRPQVWLNPKFWSGLLPEVAPYLTGQKNAEDYGVHSVLWP